MYVEIHASHTFTVAKESSITMQTVWTDEVEQLAEENMKRCAEIADCKVQISKWKQKLKKLQNEHRAKAQLAEVRRNPAHWNRLKKNEKFRKDLVEIVLSSAARGKNQEIPSLLRDWKHVPTFLRNDPDLFRLRLDCLPMVDYVPMELTHNRSIMENIFTSQPNLLKDIGSSSSIWSDRDYYKLLLLHNNVTDEETNIIFQMFHFDVRNDADVILSLTQSDETWQGLLKPSTGCFRDRVPGRLLWKNKKDVAVHVLRQSRCLRYLSNRLRDDPDIVKVALERWGGQLLHASARLRRNKNMISIACQSHPAAILYALKHSKLKLSPQEAIRVFETAEEGESPHVSPHVATQCFKFWKELPETLKCNRSVAVAASRFVLPLDRKSLPVSIVDRSFWEDVISQKYSDIMIAHIPISDVWGYDLIPKSFESIGNVACWMELSSLRVVADPAFWMAVARSGFLLDGYHNFDIPDFVFEHKEIILQACRKDGAVLSMLKNSPLAVDRDILEAALEQCPKAVIDVKDIAQLLHFDLVADAIRRIQEPSDLWDVFDFLDEDIWLYEDVALAWIEAGGDYLEDEFEDEYEDSETVFLSVAMYCPQDFWYASDELCSNKEFMLQVVKVNPALLKEASFTLRKDFDLSLVAFSRGPDLPGVFDANSQDDFDYLTSFASTVRSELLLHRSFFALVMGMESQSISLSMLNQDAETSTGMKRSIAEFLAVPTGERLHDLRCASLHLAQWGF